MLRTLLIIITLLMTTIAQAAPSIEICRDGDVFRVSGLDGIGWDAMTGGATFEDNVLIAVPLGNGTIQIVFWWTDENGNDQFGELWGNSSTQFCDDSDGWQPSAPSILIPAQEGSFKLEIQGDGKWWLVVDADHPNGIMLTAQNGFIELIGSVGQDTDPGHYRLIEVTT